MSISTPALPTPAAPLVAIVINGQVRLPANLTDLDAFRRWARSDECPEKGRFSWITGTVWVDLSLEQLYTHNQVKGEIARLLGNILEASSAGIYCLAGMQMSNPDAGLSTAPDGLYVSYDALQSGRVRQVPNDRNVGVVELEGSLDMVLEVVSNSSEETDFLTLPGAYHLANVQEFWRVDARGELRFEIFRWTAAAYVPTRQSDGWWRSDVFARDFLLTRDHDSIGQPRFTLQDRP